MIVWESAHPHHHLSVNPCKLHHMEAVCPAFYCEGDNTVPLKLFDRSLLVNVFSTVVLSSKQFDGAHFVLCTTLNMTYHSKVKEKKIFHLSKDPEIIELAVSFERCYFCLICTVFWIAWLTEEKTALLSMFDSIWTLPWSLQWQTVNCYLFVIWNVILLSIC